MSSAEPEWLLAAWVRLVQARWAATGVPRQDRARLVRQLLLDLVTARAAGARVEELVATHPAVFADACAAGLGSRLRPISTEQLVGVCLATGVVGAGLAWHFLLTVTWPEVTPWGLDEGVFNVMVDLGLIVAVLAAMVVVARLVFHRNSTVAALTLRLGVMLAAGTLVGFPLASALGATQGYSLNPAVITAEATVVLAFLTVAIVSAQRWTMSLHRMRGHDTSHVTT